VRNDERKKAREARELVWLEREREREREGEGRGRGLSKKSCQKEGTSKGNKREGGRNYARAFQPAAAPRYFRPVHQSECAPAVVSPVIETINRSKDVSERKQKDQGEIRIVCTGPANE